MKDFLSIGEMSGLFGLNVQTLYYYDSIGLFQPKLRDEKTGWRKYEFDQIYALATICYMRKLGYSLEEILQQRKTQHAHSSLESLKHRSEELHKQWQEIFFTDEAIRRKISFIEQEMDGIQTDEVAIRHYETRKYIAIGEEELLYRHNSFYFYPTIAFYKGNKKYFGAYLYQDENNMEEHLSDIVPSNQLKEIEAGDFLCTYHVGAYETVPDTINKLRDLRPDLKLEEVTINFNILDQFVEHDSANYITHMQIRILKS